MCIQKYLEGNNIQYTYDILIYMFIFLYLHPQSIIFSISYGK